MTKRRSLLPLLVSAALMSIASGCASLAALDQQATQHATLSLGPEQAAVAKPMTLPRFLGVDVVCRRTVLLGQVIRERAAVVVPALEPRPLALPLSHPANADSPSPAVAGAHKAKKAKAAKAAKVKAVGVLASLDCSADPHVEEGILAALDDVSADVRVAAVEAVLASTRGCECGCGGCCSDAIRIKLTHMVFDKTGPNCWCEPSGKARRLARLALDACGGPLEDDCGCVNGMPVEIIPAEAPAPAIIEQILMTP